jgi:hypothetical protein
MKKVLYVCAAMAVAVALAPAAFASAITYQMRFDHTATPYTLTSENAADTGSVIILNQVITNNVTGTGSDSVDLEITGFEFLLGGAGYSANTGLPSGGGSAWTYTLGAGAFSNTAAGGTGWTQNSLPTVGDAVKPDTGTGKTTDYLNSVTLGNTNQMVDGEQECYIGEILAKGASCDVELIVTANYGGAQGTASSTHLWGYAEGEEGTLAQIDNSTGTTAVDQAMVEDIDLDVAPEPASLVLLGTGFGLLGVGLFLRRRHRAAAPPTAG